MDNYFNYSYYDETGKNIAIVSRNIPKEKFIELSKQYDEIKFEEKAYERKLDC